MVYFLSLSLCGERLSEPIKIFRFRGIFIDKGGSVWYINQAVAPKDSVYLEN